MRWKKKQKSVFKPGDLRVKHKFLWFPVTINNETRWLERVGIVEKYAVYDITEYPLIPLRCFPVIKYTQGKWENYGFFGKRDKEKAIEVFVDRECP